MTHKEGFGIAICFVIYLVVVLVALTFCGCASTKLANNKPNLARVTYYHKGEDRWGSRIAMSTKARARYGRTVAARKCCFPFGTRLYFPDLVGVIDDGIFTVEDRGRDVETLKASHGTCEVVDIWSGTKRNYRRLTRKLPAYLPYYRL